MCCVLVIRHSSSIEIIMANYWKLCYNINILKLFDETINVKSNQFKQFNLYLIMPVASLVSVLTSSSSSRCFDGYDLHPPATCGQIYAFFSTQSQKWQKHQLVKMRQRRLYCPTCSASYKNTQRKENGKCYQLELMR